MPDRIADRRKCARHHDAVVTRQNTGDPLVVTLFKLDCHGPSKALDITSACYTLFGSGSSGLGWGVTP